MSKPASHRFLYVFEWVMEVSVKAPGADIELPVHGAVTMPDFS